MGKPRLPIRIGLATKISFLAISLVLAASAGISFLVIRADFRNSYRELLDTGGTIADTASRKCGHAVSAGDEASLARVVESLSAHNDILYVSVLTHRGRLLASRSFREQAKMPEVPFDDIRRAAGMRYREVESARADARFIEIVHPVYGEIIHPVYGGGAGVTTAGGKTDGEKIIGYLRLGLSREGISKSVRRLLLSMAVIAGILVPAGGMLTIYLSRRITAPIAMLKSAINELSQGNFDVAVSAQSNDEISDLAQSFERMRLSLREDRNRLVHDALHDELTGLPNRVLFIDRLNHAIVTAKRRSGFLIAVLSIDIDEFKLVNESLGHAAGDLLLKEFSARLRNCVRPGDTVARLGGDEFAVLLEDIGGQGNAIYVASRILADFSLPLNVDGREIFISSSIGISLSSTGYDSHEQALRDAELAMHRAKEQGRGTYAIYEGSMHIHAVRRLQMETDLRRAMERREFVAFYQPVLTSAGRRVEGFEALARWRHPDHGLISPAGFLHLAEETGIIVEIDRMVLEQSCEQMLRWSWMYPGNALRFMSVNLSNRSLVQQDLVEHVASVLRKTGLDPACLKLEIAESVLVKDPEAMLDLFAKLRDLGVKLIIDDFGTGHSSLGHLLRMPVHGLKIDRSFIRRIGDGGGSSAVVKAILSLSNDLGIEAVAEGIETDSQLEQITSLRCSYWQGYLFSRPVESRKASAFLA